MIIKITEKQRGVIALIGGFIFNGAIVAGGIWFIRKHFSVEHQIMFFSGMALLAILIIISTWRMLK